MDGDDLVPRTEAQEEWSRWAESGYRKMDQPRSVLRLNAVIVLILTAIILGGFYLAVHGGL
jgi:hypothetical protein